MADRLQYVVVDALGALVTSEARARALTALYGDPGRSFYQRELARTTGLPLQAVQRELRRLYQAGFIRTSTIGGRRLYQADPESAVFGELQSLVLKLRGAAAALRQALADVRGVKLVWIFGSFAAGTAGASSDIDVMVVGSASARQLRAALGPVERSLGRTVNEHVIVAQEWRQRLAKGDGFIREVRRSPKLWVVGEESALRRLDRTSA